MKAKKITCPYCSAGIGADTIGRDFVFCNYCGQKILLDDEKIEVTINKNINVNKTIHKRYTDDAEVIKAKNKEKEDKRGWIAIVVCLIISLGIPFGMLAKFEIDEKVAKNEGKVSAGYYRDLVGEDNKTVKAHFEAAGFTNIELIDLDDSGLMFWNEGKVETISVGGDTNFESTDWFEPDVKVIISYH